MDLGIAGRNALIFGAGSGLGRAIAIALAAEGCNLALAGRKLDNLRETQGRLSAHAKKSVTVPWDLAQTDAIAANLAQVEEGLGPVDILINVTGGPAPTPVSGVPPAEWRANFDMMVLSVIAITDHVLPGMKARGWGRIITNTSSGVVAPIPNLGQSNALRMALVGWSKTLASEVAPFGITSNVVVPGRILTERIQFLDSAKAKRENLDVDEVTRRSLAQIPAGRYGTPEEYADVVAFLASDRASYVTGSVVRVDGGMIAGI